MSVHAMAAVWDTDLPTAPRSYDDLTISVSTQKLLLLALADHADSEGGGVRPAVARLVRMTGLCERSVRELLRSFRDRGLLVVERPATSRRPTEYRLSPWIMGGAPGAPRPARRGALGAPARGTECTPRGALGAPDPSLTVIEPGSDVVEAPKTTTEEAPPVSRQEAAKRLKKLRKTVDTAKRRAVVAGASS